MKKNIMILSLILTSICFLSSGALAETGRGIPLKYISSCQIDVNNDKTPDIALLAETLRGRELIVLMKNESGYSAFLLSDDKLDMYLTCHYGKEIKETTAGKRKGRTFKTNGTYIQLTLPEGSSVAYYWENGKFKEVWVSD